MNKSEFLKYLRDLVGEGRTEDALDFLFKYIADFGAYFSNDIIMLKSRFQSVKNQFILRGIIDNTDFDRTNATVNLAILGIADKIEKRTDKQENNRRGHLLHKIPSKMVKSEETKCIVRIAYYFDQLLIGLTIDADTIFQDIQVTGVMSVELLDDNEVKTFEIRTSTDEEQFLIHEEFTQWIFKVRPLREGAFPLLLKIGVVEMINDKERKRNIIIEKEIKITVESSKFDRTEFSLINLEDKYYLNNINIEKEKKYKELEANRSGAERLAKIEADRMEAERLAKIEADRMEAERLAKIEADRMEAERLAKIEADRMEAERLAKIEADRLKAERLVKIEAERNEKEQAEKKRKIEEEIKRRKERKDVQNSRPSHNAPDNLNTVNNKSCLISIIFIVIVILIVLYLMFFGER